MANELPSDLGPMLGPVFIAVLLNAYFCGVVSQQQYLYWTSGFKDPIYVRAFVVVQFTVVLFQSAILWQLASDVYVDLHGVVANSKAGAWQIPVNSACQCLLILMANGSLAVRIYTLTNSRLKPSLVFGLSFSAFIVGLVTIAVDWPLRSKGLTVSGHVMSVLWRTLQAVTECLIMYFLSRALLASRSGIQKSSHTVNHLICNVIQLGLFATLWAIAGMATWFLLPRSWAYTVFDMTSGSIYTHMIYDGILSRRRLPECIAERSMFALGFPSQSLSQSSRPPRPHVAISRMTVTDFGTTTRSGLSAIGEENDSELECAPVGKSAVGYDFPCKAGE